MKLARILRRCAVGSAMLGLLTNGFVAAAAQPVNQISARDISLGQAGVLQGQVLNSEGAAVPGAVVSVLFGAREIASTRSDASGNFRIASMRGGLHQVVVAGRAANVRLWTAQTAPPAAVQGLLFVAENDQVVRGQGCPCGTSSCAGCGGGLGYGTWGTIGAIAIVAGIAYGIYAIADDDDSGS